MIFFFLFQQHFIKPKKVGYFCSYFFVTLLMTKLFLVIQGTHCQKFKYNVVFFLLTRCTKISINWMGIKNRNMLAHFVIQLLFKHFYYLAQVFCAKRPYLFLCNCDVINEKRTLMYKIALYRFELCWTLLCVLFVAL